ncbi:MAG: hypothetical protein Q8P20_10120 [bacterium]|nr:hypothetical protein [bacterium]
MKKIPRSEHNCVGALLKAAKKYGVKVETIEEEAGLRLFKKDDKNIFVSEHVVDLNTYIPSKISNNKYLVKTFLTKLKIPVPHGFKFTTLNKALEFLKKGKIKFPLVIKPVIGSQGKAVAVDIRNHKWFVRSIQEVYKYNRRMRAKKGSCLIEEYIPGNDFRFLVLDGKVLTVLMRKPAYVMGDGKHTLFELITEYNKQPGVAKDQPLCPIVVDHELARNIKIQKLTLKYIPPFKKQIFLRKNSNVSTGGRSFECFDKANDKYKRLALKIGKMFRLRFFAVDLIVKDITKFKNYAVIEINDTPGFDIHEVPYRGKPFPVSEHLVRAMFK